MTCQFPIPEHYPYPVEFDGGVVQDCFVWLKEHDLEPSRDFVLLSYVNTTRTIRFRDPNIAMLFKLSWVT